MLGMRMKNNSDRGAIGVLLRVIPGLNSSCRSVEKNFCHRALLHIPFKSHPPVFLRNPEDSFLSISLPFKNPTYLIGYNLTKIVRI
jgi:hypothetical protein